MQWIQRRNCHQQRCGSGLRSRQPRCEIGALRHLAEVARVAPSTTTAQWVDDLAQRTQSPPSEVVNKAVEAALQLVRDLQEDKLAVASKSVVIATTPSIAKQVVSTLARHDIHIQEARHAKDLWLDVSSARKPMRRRLASGLRSKPVHAFGGREHGRRKHMVRRPWVRPQRGSSKRGRERRKLHNAEAEAGG